MNMGIADSISPQELIDYIVDFLHDDPETLKACSLVSHSFASSTRVHLFNRVVIPPLGSVDAVEARAPRCCKRLYSVLMRSPHIAQNIRQLTIRNYHTLGISPIGWIENQMLHRLLEMLTRVESISLCNIGGWEYHPAGLQHAIQSILRLPCLVTLSLIEDHFASMTAMAQALHVGDWCLNLKRLEIKNLDLKNEDLPISLGDGPSPIGRVRLEELYVEANTKTTDRIIEWLLHPSSGIDVISSLHTLHVVEWHPTQCVNAFLEKVGGSVKHLEFAKRGSHYSGFRMWPQPEDNAFMRMDCTPNIETLKIRYRKLDTDTPARLWLHSFLRPSRSFVHLKSITIDVVTDEYSARLMSGADWKEVDGILMDENFPSLADVNIHVTISLKDVGHYSSSSKSIVKALEARLPRLKRRGLLVIWVICA